MTLRPFMQYFNNTVELHWPEHLLKYEKVFETGVVRANECFLVCVYFILITPATNILGSQGFFCLAVLGLTAL